MITFEDNRNVKQVGNDGKSKEGRDYCKCCKSYDLFDTQDYDSNKERFITVCQTCGTVQQDYKEQRKKRK